MSLMFAVRFFLITTADIYFARSLNCRAAPAKKLRAMNERSLAAIACSISAFSTTSARRRYGTVGPKRIGPGKNRFDLFAFWPIVTDGVRFPPMFNCFGVNSTS
jgi:hypothetical protein